MINLTLEKLASILNHGDSFDPAFSDVEFTGVTTDSRNIIHGSCFVAVKGEKFDGNDYVFDAFESGAACAVATADFKSAGKPILTVNDTIISLGDLARWYRSSLSAKVIAITGSAGKTTTREMTYCVLKNYYNCHRSPKSFNNSIGLPLTLLSAGYDHEVIIVELGTNAPGEIEYLTRIAEPDIAVVLNALPVHLEGLGSMENIIEEKVSISKGIVGSGTLLINGDSDALVRYCGGMGCNFTTFGTVPGADIFASNISLDTGRTVMTVDDTEITIPVPSRAAADNALASWAICKTIGLNLRQFADGIKTFEPVSMRMQIETCTDRSGSSITIINDCYNANPASMENALEYLSSVVSAHPGSRAVFVCGTMGELGAESASLHESTGKTAARFGVGLILAAGPFTGDLIAAAKTASEQICVHQFQNTDQLCNNLHKFIRPDDIILVKGSRSNKLEQAVMTLKNLFWQ